jgi:hypothetical protein
VLAAARIMEITDQRLWRIVVHYVGQAVARLDLTRCPSRRAQRLVPRPPGPVLADRNVTTFATMIYMIAAPLGDLFQST